MSQNNPSPEERDTIRMSGPKLAALGVGIAAVAVAATLALAPKQTVTVPQDPQSKSSIETVNELVPIPDVIGLERQSAEKTLTNARLDVGKETQEYSDTVHAGSVISQNPTAGTQANPDTKVDLVVSKGRKAPEETTMPDLKGMTREEAEKALKDAKLVAVQDADVVTGDVQPGRVCRQSIKAGTKVKQDTYVSYAIAIAPDTSVQVPNVAGEPVDDARKQLKDAGLGTDTAYAYSSTVAKDRVISQSISSGTKVAKGTVITLSVSMGAKPSGDIEVPDVVGKSSDDATNALKDAGLSPSSIKEYSDDVAEGTVMNQSIAAGTKVAKDTPVTITVSMGPRQDGSVAVPDVSNIPADKAEASLAQLGLGSERAETYSDTVPAGNVIGQSIPAGTKVAKDTVVTLTVSLGTKPEPPAPPVAHVVVPDILTYSLDDAIAALKSAGLNERWSGEENGTVVAQDPPAGTEVEQGSVVTFKLEHISSKVAVPDVSGKTVADADAQLRLAGLVLDSDGLQPDQILDGTDPVAGALVDEGTHVTAIPHEDPETQTPAPTTDDGDKGDNQKPDDQQPETDTNPAPDQKEQQDEPAGDQDAQPRPEATTNDSANSQSDMLDQALSVAGANYEVVQTLTTTPANDGTNYTFLCRDDTGEYHVVIHVPGDGSAPSLISATPATD